MTLNLLWNRVFLGYKIYDLAIFIFYDRHLITLLNYAIRLWFIQIVYMVL